MKTNPINEKIITELKIIAGEENVITESPKLEGFLLEKRGNFVSEGKVAFLAQNSAQVSQVLKLCNSLNIKVVTQGGNSSLVGSTVSSCGELILSLKQLNKIHSINSTNFTIIADAGVKLARLQEECQANNLYFPFDIPSREICTLAGLASTNAGGINALKYGVFKDLVQGLEIVLADGSVINDLHENKKRNIGVNVSSLFLGAEGLNGVITKLSLKCVPLQVSELSFVISSCNIKDILQFYNFAYNELFDFIESFEIINHKAFEVGRKASKINGFEEDFFNNDWLAIVKLATRSKCIKLDKIITSILQKYTKIKYLVLNQEQAKKLWGIRSSIHTGQKEYFKHGFKHDIAVPLSKIEELIQEGIEICKSIDKELVPVLFGHAGDGNIHFNVCTNKNLTKSLKQKTSILLKERIFEKALSLGGTFSAEHGIGIINKDFLLKYHSQHNNILIKLKEAFDKKNILNNGKTIVKT